MSGADEVAFLCALDGEGNAESLRLQVRNGGLVWVKRAGCRLVPIEAPRFECWTHRLHVPQALALANSKLAWLLSHNLEDGPRRARVPAATGYRTLPREESAAVPGSGPTAHALYVERKVARLTEGEAAGVLGLSLQAYRALELGHQDFTTTDARTRAVAALAAEGRRRTVPAR